MDLGLSGKTAIVTGGASNIGKAITEGLSREGANVVIADVDEAQSRRLSSKTCRQAAARPCSSGPMSATGSRCRP